MKSYIYLLFILVLFCGCKKAPQEPVQTHAVTLATEIEGAVDQFMPMLSTSKDGIVWRLSSSPRQTRHVTSKSDTKINAAGDGFTVGDRIGLYLVEWTGVKPGDTQTKGTLSPDKNHTDNHLFSATTISSWEGNPKTLAHPLTWRKMNGYGYFPYRASVGDATHMPITIREDQSSGLSQNDDFMWGITTEGITPRNGDPIKLSFRHCLSQIVADISLPSTYNSKTVASITAVVIENTSPTGLVNLSEGVVKSDVKTSDIKLARTSGAAASLTGKFEGIVMPSGFAHGQTFARVEFKYTDGKADALYYTIPSAGLTLAAGQRYALTLKNDELSFGGELNFAPAAGDLDLPVWSNVATPWTVKSNDSWLTVAVKPGTTYATTTTAQTGNKTLSVRATANMGGMPRVGSLTISGTVNGVAVTRTTTCYQRGIEAPANCYMIAPGEVVSFDATMIGGDLKAGLYDPRLPLKAGIKDVRILWQTAQGHANAGATVLSSVSYSAGIATVTARAGAGGGNAVIAAYDATAGGNILWSWHIWVTGDVPLSEPIPYDNQNAAGGPGKQFMDRNLGAITNAQGDVGAYGMLYQWGRKDPFTPSVGSNTNNVSLGVVQVFNASGALISTNNDGLGNSFKYLASNADNLLGAIRAPMTHYYNSDGNWTNNSAHANNYWQAPSTASAVAGYVDNRGAKTLYDPCPTGYRIAANGAYAGITGRTWTAWDKSGGTTWLGTWWPAAGRRDSSSGVLSNAGYYGWVWSSSPNSAANGYDLRFDRDGSVNPSNNYSRGYDFSVRCVTE